VNESPAPYRPSKGAVLVTGCIILAIAATLQLLVTPTTSPWFWPVAGVLGAAIALGLLTPLRLR